MEDTVNNNENTEQVILPSDQQAQDKPQETPQPQEQPQETTQEELKEDTPQNTGTVDVGAFEKEFAENGELSEASYEALARVGITREIVNRYIEGRTAYAANYDEQVMSIAGGKSEYEAMINWATDNLSDSEKESYNKAVTSRDVELAKLATAGLMAKYKSSQGNIPATTIEGGASSTSSYYSSMSQLVADQKDERYEKDPNYRQAVEDKLRRSIAGGHL